MLRSLFAGLSKAAWAQRAITSWQFARRASRRFVAGETLPEAVDAIRALNQSGINATLDFLGENTRTPAEARLAAAEAIAMLEAIDANNLRSNISLKLTQIGLGMDKHLCRELLGMVLDKTSQLNNFLRIDMEGSPVTSDTLEMFYWALEHGYRDRCGIVLQSCLLRSDKDLEKVLEKGGRVRLCKGAYQEPPSIAYPRKRQVDLSFDRLALSLLRAANTPQAPRVTTEGRVPPIPALATHDEERIRQALSMAQGLGLEKNAYEFQFLYGIRRDLQQRLSRQGHPVRVYVPYGAHRYPFCMRRLGERPANLFFFISNFFRP